mmetsp:Transcript_7557/g.13084  ORF Transcript_7557/g.13084 Transcript_7557/m.13084 type:complete len:165 (-) Transcript_7557:798-1292(-)
MFIKSAASDTRQGKAIQAVNERWGQDFRRWNGRETIGIPVCKKKYAPFSFKIVREKGEVKVTVERMFGCKCHSDLRKALIEKHGCRKGWEPFGQWSMKKAQEMAKRETDRLNSEDHGSTTDEWSSDDEKNANSICNNGSCAWRVREKYDNVKKEITGEDSDDDE